MYMATEMYLFSQFEWITTTAILFIVYFRIIVLAVKHAVLNNDGRENGLHYCSNVVISVIIL